MPSILQVNQAQAVDAREVGAVAREELRGSRQTHTGNEVVCHPDGLADGLQLKSNVARTSRRSRVERQDLQRSEQGFYLVALAQ